MTTVKKRRKRRVTESQRLHVLELLERGASQAEAAREAGVSEAFVSRLVNGKRPTAEVRDEPTPKKEISKDELIREGLLSTAPDTNPPDPIQGFESPVGEGYPGIARALDNADDIGPPASSSVLSYPKTDLKTNPVETRQAEALADHTYKGATAKPIIVVPLHGEFPMQLLDGRRGCRVTVRDPDHEPAPIRSLFFANGP